MKRVTVCFGLAFTAMTAGCAREPGDDVRRQIDALESKFDAAKLPEEFLLVAGSYAPIVEAQPGNVGALFNQANAFHRAGRKAEAIAGWRKLLRYAPRHADAQANLRVAISEHSASDITYEVPMFERVFFWQNWLGYREKWQLVIGLAAICMAIVALQAFEPFVAWSKRALWPAMAAMLLAAASFGYDHWRFDRCKHGVVRAPGAFAHTGPSKSYPQDFAVGFGVEFEVLEIRPTAELSTRIRLADGREGWIDNPIVY